MTSIKLGMFGGGVELKNFEEAPGELDIPRCPK